MPNFIDRRLNPKEKSLGNRRRFMRRAHSQIKEVVDRALKDRNITDVSSGETVTIPTKGIGEPHFRHDPATGERQHVLVGNHEFVIGDRIKKPQSGGGKGNKASDSGDGEDAFQFYLTRDEFLDVFFEDLELPDLVKTSLKQVRSFKMRRAGLTSSGTPTNINILRTARQSYGRRIALKRPRTAEILALEAEIERIDSDFENEEVREEKRAPLIEELEIMRARQKAVPYIDPIDLRYNNLQPQPAPNTNAVMFCLMDVSGSMGEREKELAKRFFMLLHLFLKRRYERIDVVFIRHAHEAQEVSEEDFFYSRETGGTVVSTVLIEMLKVVRARYPTNDWNIYAAQASDGDNFSGDSERCVRLLAEEIMPLCQYYAYVEILDEREFEIFQDSTNGAALWRSYQNVGENWSNFAMKRIARPADIYPVFRELFAKQSARG